ncbi:MAG: hypothetical protein WCS72_01515 [Deltaproteobacteria bacterium]
MGELVVALFLGFFALLAIGAAAAQLYRFTLPHHPDQRNRPPRE